MMSQPYLIKSRDVVDQRDVVFTPDYVAADMVAHFRPTGRVMDPCAGDHVFGRYLPANYEHCEIAAGVDFYAFADRVDWLIGNPPYGDFSRWLDHSLDVADQVCYLIPANKIFNSQRMIERVAGWGGAGRNAVLWHRV